MVVLAVCRSVIVLKGGRISVVMCGESVAPEAAPVGIFSSGGNCVTVAIVTTQGATISLPDLPADFLVSRIKSMIS